MRVRVGVRVRVRVRVRMTSHFPTEMCSVLVPTPGRGTRGIMGHSVVKTTRVSTS